MSYPRLIVSDQHAHNWSQFSTVDSRGENSRLRIICDEMERGAIELEKSGGNLMIMAGDLFHSRGSIDPEVFNTVHKTIENIIKRGIEIIAIPGNHDLKSRETSEIGNAIQTLGCLDGFTVITEPTVMTKINTVFIPWYSNAESLIEEITNITSAIDVSGLDLIIHAGINNVLINLPDAGLDPKAVAAWGFKRVFAGHYHNFVDLGDGVYSIGATTHQTWSDLGSKAGYLLVTESDVNYRASHAPCFVEIDADTDEEDYEAIVETATFRTCNYGRKGLSVSDNQINRFRANRLGYCQVNVS